MMRSELNEKVIKSIKDLFWKKSQPQNIMPSPIEIDCQLFLNPLSGEFTDEKGDSFPLQIKRQVQPIIKTADERFFFHDIPYLLKQDNYEISEDNFALRISIISSFIIVEYTVLNKEESRTVVWVFQLIKEIF